MVENASVSHTLILGIGNVLMGDEGVGVHAVEGLKSQNLPERVHVLDGGTGGFHLLSLFKDYRKIIVIDATMDGQPQGTVRVLYPKFASDFPRTLSAHDVGLRDMIECASLLGPLPEMILITVSIGALNGLSTDLSPQVRSALPGISEAVMNVLQQTESGVV
jgi:hydrogenase maturation protease